MKIDLFAHVCPQKFMDAFAKTKRGLTWDDISGDARIQGGAVLWDMEKRLESWTGTRTISRCSSRQPRWWSLFGPGHRLSLPELQ
jgi:hypothetical protein